MSKVEELVELLKGHRVFLQTHNFPDPDAISSAYGMQKLLKYYGIDSCICYVGSIDRISTKKMMDVFDINIMSYDDIKDMTPEDYIVHIDCQKPNSNTTDLPGDEVACIDHHPIFEHTDDYKYSDIQIVGACASLVASYYKDNGVPMDVDVASALAYGIKMDTDDLIRGVKQLDVDMFSYVFKYADWNKVRSMYSSTIEFNDLMAYGAAIEHIEVFDNIGFSCIPFECSNSLVAIISDFVLSLDVVDVSVIYSVNASGLKFSVRSETPKVDAGQLIHKAIEDYGNGGGHKVMAGGFIPNDKLEALGHDYEDKVKELFMNTINNL